MIVEIETVSTPKYTWLDFLALLTVMALSVGALMVATGNQPLGATGTGTDATAVDAGAANAAAASIDMYSCTNDVYRTVAAGYVRVVTANPGWSGAPDTAQCGAKFRDWAERARAAWSDTYLLNLGYYPTQQDGCYRAFPGDTWLQLACYTAYGALHGTSFVPCKIVVFSQDVAVGLEGLSPGESIMPFGYVTNGQSDVVNPDIGNWRWCIPSDIAA